MTFTFHLHRPSSFLWENCQFFKQMFFAKAYSHSPLGVDIDVAELWRIRGVTEWIHNGSERVILTYWQLFSWKASPREWPHRDKLPCWRYLVGHKWDLRERTETGAAFRSVDGISNMSCRQRWSTWGRKNHTVLCLRKWELTVRGSSMKWRL